MTKYNHAYDFAVEVISDDEHGDDVTADMLRLALLKRIGTISDEELVEACGQYDSHEVTP